MITIMLFAAGALFAVVMLAVVEVQMRRLVRQQHEASEALRKARNAAVGALLLTLMSCSESPTQPDYRDNPTECRPYTITGYTEREKCADNSLVMMSLVSADGKHIKRCQWRELYGVGQEIMICDE